MGSKQVLSWCPFYTGENWGLGKFKLFSQANVPRNLNLGWLWLVLFYLAPVSYNLQKEK